MEYHFVKSIYLFLVFAIVFYSCQNQVKRKEIKQALATYDRLIKKMDADSIALMYTTDGDLGIIAHGRDSIRKFLSTFTNVKVLSASSSSENIKIKDDTAVQTGRYEQVALVNNSDTVRPTGSYEAKWIWIKNEGWRIQRMTTTSDNNPNK